MRSSSPAAVRMRRLRERRARGARVVAIEVNEDLLEILEKLGLVGPDEADDPTALSFALLMVLEDGAESRRKIRDASRPRPDAGVESSTGSKDGVEYEPVGRDGSTCQKA